MIQIFDLIPTEEEIANLLAVYLEYTERKCPTTFDDVVCTMMVGCGFQIRKMVESLDKYLNSSDSVNVSGLDLIKELKIGIEELKKYD